MQSNLKRRGVDVTSSKVKLPKAATLVAQKLRTRIVRGELKEGSSLPSERDLMETFGVSRPTLREAIRILESEGLVTTLRGARGGVIVHTPNLGLAARYVSLILQSKGTTMLDILSVSAMIEPPAARIVAEQFSKKAPPLLRERLEECWTRFGNDFEFGVAIANFRSTLIELTEISTLSLLMSIINDIFQRHWSVMSEAAGRRMDNTPMKRRVLRSLEKAVDLIEAGDGPAVEKHWRQYSELTEAELREWLPVTQAIDILDD